MNQEDYDSTINSDLMTDEELRGELQKGYDDYKAGSIQDAAAAFDDFRNGCITLEPKVLATPSSISKKSLRDMEASVENFKREIVSPPVDLSDFKK